MDTTAEFIRRQYAFAAHIRDPERCPAPDDVEDRRMAIYRDLFYNNVEGFLSGTFPVLRKIHSDDDWHAMVRDYFIHHQSHTPLFLEIPREFLAWLHDERAPRNEDFPFLYELAHYEWTELALSVADEDIDTTAIDRNGDLLEGVPALSPLAWHLAYDYPVHTIGPDYLPDESQKEPTFLVVYRDTDDEVGFMVINPVTKRLMELVEANDKSSGRALLEQIAAELAHPEPDVVVNGGLDIFRNLHAKGIITGTVNM